MLTMEQVKKHSQLFLESEPPIGLKYQDFVRCRARLLYLFNKRLNKLDIICALPTMIPRVDIWELNQEDVSLFIEWEKFTEFVNKYDDLSEEMLLMPEEYSDYLTKHRKERGIMGRNGTLNYIQDKVIDYGKMVLV